jgi:creatinine amidohydrolase/Fe(II)-dependent formamide hydrolase-like protein
MAGCRTHAAPASSARPVLPVHQAEGARRALPTRIPDARGAEGRATTLHKRVINGSIRRSEMATPQRLKTLPPDRVAAAIAADPRLIVPIGTCDPHGPHLPMGCDTVLVDRLADDLSAEFGVLRAATIEYGASDGATHAAARAGSVRKKTLHLLLNDLLGSWERAGIREFILLTAHGDDAHHEALATVMTAEARVRVVDASAVRLDKSVAASAGWQPGGKADTSLMLYLAPHLVDMRLAQDYTPQSTKRRPILRSRSRRGVTDVPAESGVPRDASPAIGEAAYNHIRERIAERIFRSSTSVE